MSSVPTPVLKVSVLRDGKVLADSHEVALPALDSLLSELSKRKGAVWYYREGGDQPLSASAKQVMTDVLGAIVRHRLPVSLSTKPDFSDYIGPDGQPHPRATP